MGTKRTAPGCANISCIPLLILTLSSPLDQGKITQECSVLEHWLTLQLLPQIGLPIQNQYKTFRSSKLKQGLA